MPNEQVKLAVVQNVLILRTLDLLRLLRIFMNEEISRNEVIDLLSTNSGWLKVDDEEWRIIQKQED